MIVDHSKPTWHSIEDFDPMPVRFNAVSEPVVTADQYLEFGELREDSVVMDLGAWSALTGILMDGRLRKGGRVIREVREQLGDPLPLLCRSASVRWSPWAARSQCARSSRRTPMPQHRRSAPPPADDDTLAQDPLLLRRLLRAKDRMDAASHEAWPVPRLADVSGASPAHFARSFKQAFGLPPHRYLLTRRIERATALLRETELSVTEIAFQTGWESLGTFGRTFRDIVGASPGAVRARERAAPRELAAVPHCIASAAHRPELTMAVSEKRRREDAGTNEALIQPEENQ